MGAHAALYMPLRLGNGLRLANRLAVAPMTRVSATADGRATPQMADYYEAYAAGGFGLVITEGVYTDQAHAQGYLFQPGLTDDAQKTIINQAIRALDDARRGQVVIRLLPPRQRPGLLSIVTDDDILTLNENGASAA